MNKLYKMIVILAMMFTFTDIYAQGAYVTWPLSSTTTISPSTPVGNIQATTQTIGTSNPQMTVSLPYTTEGQRLYFQNNGWPASPVDYSRYIQHEVTPIAGNNFHVQYVSFNYGDNPDTTRNFNIVESEVWYSLDNWNTKVQLNTSPLGYLNTSMQTFSKSLSVVVASGQTFSLRIFPYSPNGGVAMTQTFAIHNTVLIEGTTSQSSTSICTDFEDGNGGWTTNNALGTIIEDGENHYFQTTDQSGASSFFNESEPLTGDWAAFLDGGCGTLCWDVNYLFAGNGNDGSSQPITVTPYIAIVGNGFSAYFLTNDLITAEDGWHSYCAPLALINPGESLPANSEGHWVMSIGTDGDWNSMLSNITKVAFGIDPTSYQAERFGFDNICLNTVDCTEPSDECDLLGATANKTSVDDCCWSLSLTQPTNLTGVSAIQILCSLPNQFTTGTGLGANYQDWFNIGLNTFTSPTGVVSGGDLTDFFDMCISYVTTPQEVVVNWLDDMGGIVCADTLKLDCKLSCTSISIDTVVCVGNNYDLVYSFTNNADYSISNIEYTLQSPNTVIISPLTTVVTPNVLTGSTSLPQHISIMGAVPGDVVSVLAKFNSPDGCCWCYETIEVEIPDCATVCDSISVEANGTPEDCCYAITLHNESSVTFTNVEFELLSGGMFSTVATTTVPGWGFTNAFPNNVVNLVKFPISQGIGNGTFANILDLCVRQYSSPTQVIEVRWMKAGELFCSDTLTFECTTLELPTDSCSQVIEDELICLDNGTYQYTFRVQNNSNIASTGYGIYPTTTGVSFSQTLFQNMSILPGQVSLLNTIIITGIGGGEELCFTTAIFTTVTPGENVYNFCCHSDTMCIVTPVCEGQSDCIPPPSGMVAWWTFDELTGTSSTDLMGFNNVGTQVNSPLQVPGMVDGALQFDGVNNYVEVPNQPELNFGTGDFSFDAWIYTTDGNGVRNLIDKRLTNVLGFSGYSVFLFNGKLSLQLANQSYTNYFSSFFVATGKWHHIAITVQRNSKTGITFYMDGLQQQLGDPTPHSSSLDNTSPLRIASGSNGFVYPFAGILDEIELFNRALPDSTIFALYVAGSEGKCKPISDVEVDSQIPSEYNLMQSYPNPFNPSTIIKYAIPKQSLVKIVVYDILGREVRVLVNEQMIAGSYEVVFDAANLASGIYIYTLRTGDFFQSKKMILMK